MGENYEAGVGIVILRFRAGIFLKHVSKVFVLLVGQIFETKPDFVILVQLESVPLSVVPPQDIVQQTSCYDCDAVAVAMSALSSE